jgi:hypothetical protein
MPMTTLQIIVVCVLCFGAGFLLGMVFLTWMVLKMLDEIISNW